MKTREIEVWVSPAMWEEDPQQQFGNIQSVECGEPTYYKKAKLIIEVPDKRIEISESEFDEAVAMLWKQRCGEKLVAVSPDLLKQKLFGSEK